MAKQLKTMSGYDCRNKYASLNATGNCPADMERLNDSVKNGAISSVTSFITDACIMLYSTVQVESWPARPWPEIFSGVYSRPFRLFDSFPFPSLPPSLSPSRSDPQIQLRDLGSTVSSTAGKRHLSLHHQTRFLGSKIHEKCVCGGAFLVYWKLSERVWLLQMCPISVKRNL